MFKKTNYLLIALSFLIQINLHAKLQGNPGEVFPVLAKPNKSYKNLTVEIDGSVYELLPLPFSKQGQYIEIGDKNIYVIEKDFGESRITILDDSKVNLSEEDSQRAYKESQLIRSSLNSYSTNIKPSLKFISPVDGIISSRYGKQRYINDQPRSPHLALDIAAAEGTEIIAPAPGKVILVGDFCSGVFGNSSGLFAIKSYCPRSVDIVALFLSSTSIVSLTSGSSLVTSRRVFSGIAACPLFSRLEGISTWIEISRSVVLRTVFSFPASISAHPKMGKVDLVGVALDSFWSACCSSVLDVENFMFFNL